MGVVLTSLLGQQLGHLRVVDLLGKGGMGEVYVGYDETLERKVALKTIRADHRLDAIARARFLREARVLSQLHHPNICQIFDYIEGVDADVLVLELVQGQSLRHAAGSLSFRDKLRVSLELTSVLVVAHEKGIVHRDLKPDNVMLDRQGRVKVLDFGLSRSKADQDTLALSKGGRRSEHSVDSRPNLTSAGMIIGTLGYMSPEQARGDEATPASDMCSLGLVLQELFTGEPPFDPHISAHEILRRAAEGQSRPVNGVDGDIAALIDRLKSDTPDLRPTAVDASERIQRIIDRPVRRMKLMLTIASMIVLALFSGFMGIQTTRAKRAEATALRAQADAAMEAETSRSVSNFLVDIFRHSDPYQTEVTTGETSAQDLIERGVTRINRELKDQPEIRARLIATAGEAYRNLADLEKAETLLTDGLRIREEVLPADHPEIADSLQKLASLYRDQARLEDAELLLKRALSIRESAFGPSHRTVAETLHSLATVYQEMGRYDEAEARYVESLVAREQTLGGQHPDVAATANGLAVLYAVQGQFADAEPLLNRSLAIREKSLGPVHPIVGDTINNLAQVYSEQERYGEAEELFDRSRRIYEQTLGVDHPAVADSLNNQAIMAKHQGRNAEARQLYGQSLAIYERTYGPDHPYVAMVLANLAELAGDTEQFSEAYELFTRSLGISERAFGRDHPDVRETLYQFGRIKAAQGRNEEALELLDRALQGEPALNFSPSVRKDYAPLAHEPAFEALLDRTEQTSPASETRPH